MFKHIGLNARVMVVSARVPTQIVKTDQQDVVGEINSLRGPASYGLAV